MNCKNNGFQTRFPEDFPCLPLVSQTDSPAINSHHWFLCFPDENSHSEQFLWYLNNDKITLWVLVSHPYKMASHFSGHHIYLDGKWYFCLSMSCHVWIAHRGGGGDSSAFHFYKHSHGTHETHVSTCCSWSVEKRPSTANPDSLLHSVNLSMLHLHFSSLCLILFLMSSQSPSKGLR